MDAVSLSSTWTLAIGLAGGGLNAIVTDNMRLSPLIIKVEPHKRIVRPGLLANMGIGAAATFACSLTLAALNCSFGSNSAGDLLAAVGLLIGFLAARSVTIEIDNRLLRVAVCRASAAPAAHPDTVRAMELVPPYVIYKTADELMPRRRWSR